jgi:RimJ/RimL family protein N-acetyltransferase
MSLGVDRVTTDRLIGRRPEPGDLGDLQRIWTDARIPEEQWPADLRTAADAQRVLESDFAHWERWGFGAWTVLERESGQTVGRIGIEHTTVADRAEVEVLWFVDTDCAGRGYATEMAREALRAGFDVLELDDLVAFTMTTNTASQAVIRKLGFTFEREIEHAGLPHVLFRLTRSDRERLERGADG